MQLVQAMFVQLELRIPEACPYPARAASLCKSQIQAGVQLELQVSDTCPCAAGTCIPEGRPACSYGRQS